MCQEQNLSAFSLCSANTSPFPFLLISIQIETRSEILLVRCTQSLSSTRPFFRGSLTTQVAFLPCLSTLQLAYYTLFLSDRVVSALVPSYYNMSETLLVYYENLGTLYLRPLQEVIEQSTRLTFMIPISKQFQYSTFGI